LKKSPRLGQNFSHTGGRVFLRVVLLLALLLLVLFGGSLFYGAKTVHDLFENNRALKQAIANLTREEQIGYAKVITQQDIDGRLFTTLKFIETARDNPLQKVLEREYTIEGDVIFFDALIVCFEDEAVMGGGRRALYLWRRVYGETMAPAQGFPIEFASEKPMRYGDLLDRLPSADQGLFWEAIWRLANDPEALKAHGIKAVYGNAVYKKLRPGLIYVFKISSTGQVYPETVPDF
jgi:hypothetical protein